MAEMLFENVHIVPAFQDQTGAAIAADWVKLTNYDKCLILFHEMRGADATATVLRLDVAKTAAGGDATTIALSNFWYVQDVASNTGDVGAAAAATVGVTDVWTKGTAAATFSGSTTASKGQWVAIEVKAEDLGDGFDWLQLQVVSSNAAHYMSAWYILYGPRFARAGANQPTQIA